MNPIRYLVLIIQLIFYVVALLTHTHIYIEQGSHVNHEKQNFFFGFYFTLSYNFSVKKKLKSKNKIKKRKKEAFATLLTIPNPKSHYTNLTFNSLCSIINQNLPYTIDERT